MHGSVLQQDIDQRRRGTDPPGDITLGQALNPTQGDHILGAGRQLPQRPDH